MFHKKCAKKDVFILFYYFHALSALNHNSKIVIDLTQRYIPKDNPPVEKNFATAILSKNTGRRARILFETLLFDGKSGL